MKFNLKTPGRKMTMRRRNSTRKLIIVQNRTGGADGNGAPAAGDEKSVLITRGLGGKKNISDVDCCATRPPLHGSETGTGQ